MDGLLLINKPVDWTSFDIVAKTRSVLRANNATRPKVGHSGTLDPKAEGLLIVLIGSYTKRAETFSKLEKTYEATLFLGTKSATGDDEGFKTIVSKKRPSELELKNVFQTFIGKQLQTPPIYSAIKINGQRAYKLARRGQVPEMRPRSIKIYELELIDYNYPELKFQARVSSGTYIRSLAEDIGQKLGTGAYLARLVRTKIGQFSVSKAIQPENLTFDQIADNLITV